MLCEKVPPYGRGFRADKLFMGYDLLDFSSYGTGGYRDTCFKLKLLQKGRKLCKKTIFKNLPQSKFFTVVAVKTKILLDLTPNLLVRIYRFFGETFFLQYFPFPRKVETHEFLRDDGKIFASLHIFIHKHCNHLTFRIPCIVIYS